VQYSYWKLTADNHIGNLDMALWIWENQYSHSNIRECRTAKRRNHKKCVTNQGQPTEDRPWITQRKGNC
jgi:hypothetical protein